MKPEQQFERAWQTVTRFVPVGIAAEKLTSTQGSIGLHCVVRLDGHPDGPWQVFNFDGTDSRGYRITGVALYGADNPHDALVDCLMKAVANACDDNRYKKFKAIDRVGCRVCSECRHYSHHWIEGLYKPSDVGNEPNDPPTHVCKHCDMLGVECPDCFGSGCYTCEGEGVVCVESPSKIKCP